MPWEGAVMNWWSCRPVELAEIFLRGYRGNREKIMNGWAAAGNSHDLNDSGPALRDTVSSLAAAKQLPVSLSGFRGKEWELVGRSGTQTL